jgi:hypothetical protein
MLLVGGAPSASNSSIEASVSMGNIEGRYAKTVGHGRNALLG